MHINHTHSHFDLHFTDRLQQVQQLFEHHPVLSMKKNILDSLHFQQVIQLQQAVSQLHDIILTKEKPLLSQITLEKPQLVFDSTPRELHDEEKEFVQKYAFLVRQHFGPIFTQLEEYAIISDTKQYHSAYIDYQHFQQSVDAISQKKQLHHILDKQALLAKKIGFRLQTDASTIHTDVSRLKSTLLDQQAVLARLPQFSLKRQPL